jgi:hypothetical protein
LEGRDGMISTLSDLQYLLDKFVQEIRRIDLPPLRVSKLYDLFLHKGNAHADVDSEWNNKWPNSDNAGVYIFLNEELGEKCGTEKCGTSINK